MKIKNKVIVLFCLMVVAIFSLVLGVNEVSAKTVFHKKAEEVKSTTPITYTEWYAKQFDGNGMLLGAEEHIRSCIGSQGIYTKISAMPTELKNAPQDVLVKINSSVVTKYQIKPLTNDDFLFYLQFNYKSNSGDSKNLVGVFACYFQGYNNYARRIYLGVEDLDEEENQISDNELNEKVQEAVDKVDGMYGYGNKKLK